MTTIFALNFTAQCGSCWKEDGTETMMQTHWEPENDQFEISCDRCGNSAWIYYKMGVADP